MAPTTPEANDTSYVNMGESRDGFDETLLGKHCEYDYCNQLDFLPFFCQSCKKTFCLDHRSETSHKCTNAGAWAERRRQAQAATHSHGQGRLMRDAVSEKPCASPSCKTTIGTSLVPGVHCSTCNRDYCLKHRLNEDHNCKNLVPIGARAGGSQMDVVASRTKSALDKLRAWGSAKKEQAGRALPKPKPTSVSQRMIAVNNLKKTAKGDDKLAPEKRIYVYVEAEAETAKAKFPKGAFFFSKDWVVGRKMALPPCHMFAQFYVSYPRARRGNAAVEDAEEKPKGHLHCQLYQRSCDMGLGVPFNIASYALLTHMIARACDLVPGSLTHVMGDAHVYLDHVGALETQLEREPKDFPLLEMTREAGCDIDGWKAEDFVVKGYDPHKTIAMKMSV
ncbi:hypothetical protein BN1723_016139, partial [Verticillium longisporum]